MKKLAEHTSNLLDSLYKYLLAAVLIFIPLYPKFPLLTVPYTYVAIRAEDFLIALVWLIFVIKLLVERKIKPPRISFQFGVFFMVGLISSISAILITQNVQPLLVILHFFRRLEYISVFFLIYFAGRDAGVRRYYFELLLLPAIGVFLYGIAQIYFGAPVISTMDAESSKGMALVLRPGVTLNSTFAGHYDLAVYLTMMLTVLVAISSSLNSWIKRIPFMVFFVLLLWLFMQAGSRISLIGLLLAISLVTLIYRRYFLGFVFFCIVSALMLTSPQYIDRFKSIFNVISVKFSESIIPSTYAFAESTASSSPVVNTMVTPPVKIQDISSSIRFNVEWPRAMRSFYKNPFLGTGYSSIELATDNDYLRALGETGLLGLLSFLALLIGIGKFLLNHVKKTSDFDKTIIVAAIGIFVSFLTTANFIDVFESSKIAILFWAFMGLAFSTHSK